MEEGVGKVTQSAPRIGSESLDQEDIQLFLNNKQPPKGKSHLI